MKPLLPLVLLVACAASVAQPQLSSPIAPSATPQPARPGAPVVNPPLGSIDGVAGSGPGVHGAGSPFPQLQDRADVVPWSTLTAVKTRVEKKRILPVFPAPVQALHSKTQRIQGFMMPLEPGEKQRHFLLSSVPLTCSFCLPGGPESMVEVRTRSPVKYSMEPVVVEGTFAVLQDDPYGLYYRITDAVATR